MKHRTLPPLLADTTYRTQGFERLEFSTRKLYQDMKGEDTAILRLHLSNATILEIPIADEDLRHHMRLLMEAFPNDALDHLVERWPQEVSRKGSLSDP